jgi:hypothetical protein
VLAFAACKAKKPTAAASNAKPAFTSPDTQVVAVPAAKISKTVVEAIPPKPAPAKTITWLDFESGYKKAIADGMPALAITDHGNMLGAFDFVNEAYKHKNDDGTLKVKPIVGCEFYVVADRHQKTFTKEKKDQQSKESNRQHPKTKRQQHLNLKLNLLRVNQVHRLRLKQRTSRFRMRSGRLLRSITIKTKSNIFTS